MTSKWSSVFIIGSVLLCSLAYAEDSQSSATLPITTKSVKARRLFNQAWLLAVDQVEQAKAIDALRKAVKADPNFAFGHEILAQTSLDPAEQFREQVRATATKAHASPAEQSVIEWFQAAADHNLINAITDMNDVLRQYPHDRWVVYLANNWLTLQTQYERAAAIYEESGISDSPGLMNNVAYTYAYMRDFDKAFAEMDKYIKAMPDNPNPQDSYAEILRMAGHFDEAIEHYQAALAMNPNFYSSQFGIADTYSLKGDQERARREYDAAFQKFSLPELHRVQWKTREAVTYVRDNNWKEADAAFQAIADYAHARRMTQVEADAYRQMAIYQPSSKRALFCLTKAEYALNEPASMSTTNLQQTRAAVLRARVEVEIKANDNNASETGVMQLSRLAETSDDKLIETAYHGAAGALLFSRRDYKGAIAHLENDDNDPRSLMLLLASYKKEGAWPDAKRLDNVLLNFNDPTLEQALVIPAFRKCFEKHTCDTSLKNAAFQK